MIFQRSVAKVWAIMCSGSNGHSSAIYVRLGMIVILLAAQIGTISAHFGHRSDSRWHGLSGALPETLANRRQTCLLGYVNFPGQPLILEGPRKR